MAGHAVIRTFNRYIDSPIKGYDDIREGDYVRFGGFATMASASAERTLAEYLSRFIPKKSWAAVVQVWVWPWSGGRSRITTDILMSGASRTRERPCVFICLQPGQDLMTMKRP